MTTPNDLHGWREALEIVLLLTTTATGAGAWCLRRVHAPLAQLQAALERLQREATQHAEALATVQVRLESVEERTEFLLGRLP